MPRPVVFLVLARSLVLSDDVAGVLIDRDAGGDPGLLVIPHPKPIHVDAGRLLLDEGRRTPQPGEVGRRGGVDRVSMGIGLGRQLDLGPRDPQEAERVVAGQLAGLGRAHHVVRHGGDGRGRPGQWAEGAERSQGCHG